MGQKHTTPHRDPDTIAANSSESLFSRLPDELFQVVIGYLDDKSLAMVGASSMYLRRVVPPVALIKLHGKHRFYGDYADVPKQLAQIPGPDTDLPSSVDSFRLSLRWRDQGWGNQKGTLYLYLFRDGLFQGQHTLISPAPQIWQSVKVYIGPDNPLIQQIQKGDKLQLWYLVGGGGGHQLFIEDISIVLRYSTEVGSARRHHNYEVERKTIAAYEDFTSKLNDDQFSASSEYNSDHFAHYSKLGLKITSHCSGGWCAGTSDNDQWIQVDFRSVYNIISVALQARDRPTPTSCEQYITSFKLAVSVDCTTWAMLNDGKCYPGNIDTFSTHFYQLVEARGRYLRLYPVDWVGHISMRWGFSALPVAEEDIPDITKKILLVSTEQYRYKQYIADKRAKIVACMNSLQDSQFSASSEWDGTHRTHACYFSRLDSTQTAGCSSAWCSGIVDEHQWIQLDMEKLVKFMAFAIQGRGDCHQWVKKFRLGVSIDGKKFKMLNDGEVFDGNIDMKTVVYHDLDRQDARGRYFRVYPTEWSWHVSMRFGVLWETDEG